jgi:peptide-methionine (S)-S-oxide reductase
MIGRFLLITLAAAVVVGLASGAQVSENSKAARNARRGKVIPAARRTAAFEAESAAEGQPPGTAADPFDAVAATVEKSGGSKTKRSDGKSGSDDGSTESARGKIERATFGAGCFWHVEQAFEWLPGVKSAVSGYSGGGVAHPSYEEVHEGITGHAEVVQVEYDPSVISYEQLLKVFWSHHDPTQLNRQGPDVGTQYRSVILYHTPAQKEAALKSYRDLMAAHVYSAPIVTQLLPMRAFYRAEDYHQDYYGGKDEPRATSRTRRTRKAAGAVRPRAKVAATGKTKPGGADVSTAPSTSPAARARPAVVTGGSAPSSDGRGRDGAEPEG